MAIRRRVPLVIAILALLVIPALVEAQESRLVRLSYSSGWDALPAVVAIERGFFEQEGLIVSGLAVSSAEAVINSLVAGSTDLASVPQRTLLIMAAADVPVKVVALAGWGTEMELVARPDSGIRTLGDIKGKKVAITRGSEAFPVLIRLLNQAGLRPQDIELQQISGDEITQAFAKATADAVFETRHFTSALVQTSGAAVVLAPNDVVKAVGSFAGRPLVAGNKVIEKEPETMQRAVTAWVKALKYIEQDPDDAARLLQIFFHRQGVQLTTEMAKSWVEMTRYDRYVWSDAAVTDAEYNGWALQAGNILKVAPKLGGHVENRFATAAARALEGS
ncbi:MAG TPA: ABC transporter substrate-binding protein [Kiloniellales bacterium]